MRVTGDWKVILPPLPVAAEAFILPLIVVLFVEELRVILPPLPALEE